MKAALDGKPAPYSKDELDDLATHCTEAEDAANKVEREPFVHLEESSTDVKGVKGRGEEFGCIVGKS